LIYYVFYRFIADNPGLWTFHCHIDWHQLSGMNVNFAEGVTELRKFNYTVQAIQTCNEQKITIGPKTDVSEDLEEQGYLPSVPNNSVTPVSREEDMQEMMERRRQEMRERYRQERERQDSERDRQERERQDTERVMQLQMIREILEKENLEPERVMQLQMLRERLEKEIQERNERYV